MHQDWAKNRAAIYWETTQEEVAVGEIGSLVYCNTFWEQKMTSAHQPKDGHQGLKCEQKRGPNSKHWRISSSEVTQDRRSQQKRLKQKPERWGKLAECSIWKPDKDSSQSCCQSRELRAENPITGVSKKDNSGEVAGATQTEMPTYSQLFQRD